MAPVREASLVLKDGKTVISGMTLDSPGFLRCIVIAEYDGKKYKGLATVAFDPLKIEPTTEVPADFIRFWQDSKAQAEKIPLNSRLTLLPERCTDKVNVYHVEFQNDAAGSRIYGILCVPKAEGEYPALLKLPGAGVRSYSGERDLAEKDIITLEIGIHGIPVNMEGSVYQSLKEGALDGYQYINLDNKDKYYYKRVYLGCIKAVDFIFSLPQFNGSGLAVAGGSQGGALSLITAALDDRVKFVVALAPGLCDLTGYLHGRAGGTRMFNETNAPFNAKADRIETSKYYDVVNFARLIRIPGFYSWGYNDETCPPTTMYSAYNVITAPKELFLAYDANHWYYREQWEKANNWLLANLKKEGGK